MVDCPVAPFNAITKLTIKNASAAMPITSRKLKANRTVPIRRGGRELPLKEGKDQVSLSKQAATLFGV